MKGTPKPGKLHRDQAGETTRMNFLIMARASAAPEAGAHPRAELVEAMLDFDDALGEARVPVPAEGFYPGSEDTHRCGAFWIIDVCSEEEAISWARRVPRVTGSEPIEVREVVGTTEILDDMLRPVPACVSYHAPA
jgi:hypothetical protein